MNALASDGHIRLIVKDQGPGVPLAERSRLFAEFPKISNQPTGGESSTGLGLAIVKTLAEAQGGKGRRRVSRRDRLNLLGRHPGGESSGAVNVGGLNAR